ncbi:Mus7/MMS22 family-domain-containing protein [Myxozyma melibiosi]|uniref:Mus7/MMS22 family-domain-containing protein n=1 Tax=Myxozyma melibiosi TaxID=54550 RepID=A0ABR1FCJ5_9ASCO
MALFAERYISDSEDSDAFSVDIAEHLFDGSSNGGGGEREGYDFDELDFLSKPGDQVLNIEKVDTDANSISGHDAEILDEAGVLNSPPQKQLPQHSHAQNSPSQSQAELQAVSRHDRITHDPGGDSVSYASPVERDESTVQQSAEGMTGGLEMIPDSFRDDQGDDGDVSEAETVMTPSKTRDAETISRDLHLPAMNLFSDDSSQLPPDIPLLPRTNSHPTTPPPADGSAIVDSTTSPSPSRDISRLISSPLSSPLSELSSFEDIDLSSLFPSSGNANLTDKDTSEMSNSSSISTTRDDQASVTTSNNSATSDPTNSATQRQPSEIENFDPTAIVDANGGEFHFFRKRTARQIMPYRFDRQIYEQQLKRRGIRPIRISTEKKISKDAARDPEDSVFEMPSTLDDASEGSSRLMSTQISESDSVESRERSGQSLEKQKGTKRKPSRPHLSPHKRSDRPHRRDEQRTDHDIYEFPSDSQTTSSHADNITDTQSRRTFNPPASSPSRGTSTSTASAATIHPPRTPSPTSSSASDASSSSDLSDESSDDSSELELERLKRRVRGVLPPSFLTLANASKPSKAGARLLPSQMHPVGEEPRKGVARRKIGYSRPREEGVNRNFIGDSSDSDNEVGSRSSSVLPASQRSRNMSTPRRFYDDLESDALEVAEHIDRMAPRTIRTPRSTQSSVGPRRQRTKSGKKSSGMSRQTTLSRHSKEKRHKKTKHARQSRAYEKRLPKIGILDAFLTSQESSRSRATPQIDDALPSSPPRFIKIAAREAAKRDGFGRASPSRKTFYFDDSDDNETVTDVLQRWREGTHEGFETASLVFTRGDSSHPTPMSMPDTGIAATPTKTNETGAVPRRRLPPGVIAVVPPPPGVVQVMGPPLHPFRRQRPWDYEEVESGEYAVRRRRRNVKIDRVFASGPRLVPEEELRRHNLLPKRSSTDKPRERQSKKQTMLKPQQRLKGSDHPPSFINLADDVEDDIPHFNDEPVSAPAPSVQRPATSSQVSIRSNDLQPDKERLISEFNFPVLNFSVTFDVFPLQDQTRFALSTFVGQGGLDNTLNMAPACENFDAIRPTEFYFTAGGLVLIWQNVSASVLSEIESGYRTILDWALSEQHSTSQLTEEQYGQAYEFCGFLARYIRNNLVHESYDSIIRFAAVIKRQTVHVSDLFTQFHGRTPTFSRLSFYMLVFQLLFIYEICAMLQSNLDDYSHLSLDREFVNIGRLLVQVMLKYGMKDLYQFLRTYRSRLGLRIDRDAYFIEVWIMTINVIDSASALQGTTIPSFWELLYSFLDAKSLGDAFNVDKYEKVWYATFSICPLYQFDSKGISDVELSRANWTAIETMVGRLLSIPRESTTSREFGSYCHASFARCLTLSLTWRWFGSKALATMMYRFFAVRKLENLESETSTGFPDFLLDKDHTLELSMSDTVFHIFLKYLAKLIRDTGERSDAKKVLPSLVGLVTPLNGRLYPRTMELKVSDLEALENNYSLLLTLFWAAPPYLRPPIGHLRDVIILGRSHAQARILSVKAWYYLTRLQLGSDGACDLSETGEWYADLLRYSLEDYLQLEDVVSGISIEESKRRRANIRAYEALLKDSLKYVRMLVCAHNLIRTAEQAIGVLKYANIGELFNNGLSLPGKVLTEALQIVKDFVSLADRIIQSPLPPHVDEDSPDSYLDDGLAQYILEEENRQFQDEKREKLAQAVLDLVFNQLHQLLSNLVGVTRDNETESMAQTEEALMVCAIETWAVVAKFVISARFKDWSYFLEGRGAWSWFANTRRKSAYEKVWMEQFDRLRGLQLRELEE